MVRTFKCKLCKNNKDVYNRSKILVWSPSEFDEIFQGDICNTCYYKIHCICSQKYLDDTTKKTLTEWQIIK